MVFGSYSSSTAASASANNLSKDVPLVAPPDDTVSDLSWSPVADFLAVSSWNKEVRVYEVSKDLQSQGKVAFQHEAPVFNCCWSHVSNLKQAWLFVCFIIFLPSCLRKQRIET